MTFNRQYPGILFPGRTDRDPGDEKLHEPDALPLIDSMKPSTWLNAAFHVVRFNPDMVILPLWVSFWAPQFWTITSIVKRHCKARILYLCHNVVEHESSRIGKILTRMVLSTGDFFIVHSEEERRGLLAMFPGANVQKAPHPTYNVFNFRRFNPVTIKEKYDLTGNVILFFGFVREYKGLRYLIKALPQVLSEMDVTLLVVGEFWRDKNEYVQMIRERDVESAVVIVDQYVPNEAIGYYFSAADLVVQPYISATGSGVIQTAFGFDKPVIATKVGCLPEIVENGKTGFLVPPRDAEALAQAIVRFFREKKSEEFVNHVRDERRRFSWENMVETIESFSQTK